ncbi:MAG: hypothetical protein ABR503_14710, partial [Chitinophagaceae bacterium]
ISGGDARKLLNLLELVVQPIPTFPKGRPSNTHGQLSEEQKNIQSSGFGRSEAPPSEGFGEAVVHLRHRIIPTPT